MLGCSLNLELLPQRRAKFIQKLKTTFESSLIVTYFTDALRKIFRLAVVYMIQIDNHCY